MSVGLTVTNGGTSTRKSLVKVLSVLRFFEIIFILSQYSARQIVRYFLFVKASD
jgi:hypothetical protein